MPARRSTSRTPAALDLLAATLLISATTLARGLGMSVKSALALLEAFVREGIAVEVTHRVARRLFALEGVGEEVRQVVRPPRRPEPGRRPGRPRRDMPEPKAPDAPAPLPAFHPVARLPPIDYAWLDAAMAQADQVICGARRRLAAAERLAVGEWLGYLPGQTGAAVSRARSGKAPSLMCAITSMPGCAQCEMARAAPCRGLLGHLLLGRG